MDCGLDVEPTKYISGSTGGTDEHMDGEGLAIVYWLSKHEFSKHEPFPIRPMFRAEGSSWRREGKEFSQTSTDFVYFILITEVKKKPKNKSVQRWIGGEVWKTLM